MQRVVSARVTVDGEVVGRCEAGLCVLVAAGVGDSEANAEKMADRVWGMRIFPDSEGKMNVALKDRESPQVLAVSNFTVLGDPSQRRPSFTSAASYEIGERLFNHFVAALRALGSHVETGVFGADMLVEIANDGPVTLVAES
ncbi:MAG: D-tyrosyl-tRNA(Tyr) deacylase [Fimbriimonadaceae bacterium]|nr:D-tyrosyl-tRNA(Tyr) deacylase [Fimbriimonadaceae bacterium]QYK55120.1 MAG: D-tyrosyl-tRNA(Tyr) deacylase [Fimbriimonadaceae bacterium]